MNVDCALVSPLSLTSLLTQMRLCDTPIWKDTKDASYVNNNNHNNHNNNKKLNKRYRKIQKNKSLDHSAKCEELIMLSLRT